MRYVGNASLSEQIQERILTTFQQTLGLAQEGNRQEALLGCDFVLRLDPLFEPARQLQTRLNEGEGPIEVADLADAADTGAAEAVAGSETGPEVDTGIEPTLESVEPLADVIDDNLPSQLALLLEQRNFEDLQSLALENQERITSDPSLQQIVQAGLEKMEAQPYVDSFLESSDKARSEGDIEAARGHLDKARELDPTHPRLVALEADLDGAVSTVVDEPIIEAVVADELTPETPVLGEGDDPLADPVTEAASGADSNADWLDELEAPADVIGDPIDIELPDEVEPGDDADTAVAPPDGIPAQEVVTAGDGEPAAQLDSETEGRIDQLLAEGQEAFEKGEYQTAIDAWSRIFLIDIDHAEASRRIELARKLKAEVERQVEEAFHEAIQLIEAGKKDVAKEAFSKVLEMHPGHMGAKEYLDRIDKGGLETAAPARYETVPDLQPLTEAEAAPAEAASETIEAIELAPDLTPEPEPGIPDFETPFEEIPSPAKQPKKRSFALVATAVLVLVLAVGWFLYSKRQSFFPNSDPQTQETAQSRVDPIERARELHEEGKTAMAINVLKRLPPSHPQHAEGLSLIEAWEIIETAESVVAAGPSEEDLLRRDALLERAQSAANRRENLAALDLLEQADAILPLDGEDANLRLLTTDKLSDLADEMELFDQGDWEYALPSLWRLHDADESNRDVRRLMVDSYYNLGLRDLQRGDTKDAAEKFQEALQLDPKDAEVQRLAEFASAYSQRPSDLLYKIFVKYHPFR